ncbi:MAG: glycosyltransferase [Bryobacterales bacterium]|nr:glycosyltransferase [Bryobacterales bacterium]
MPNAHKSYIIFVMNRWLSAVGGIQTVNRELACAIASLDSSVQCVALVASADDVDRAHAAAHRVDLIAGKSEDDWSSALLSPEIEAIPAEDVRAVIGHSYFSGNQAVDLRDRFFSSARCIHFVHMSPLDTESLKEYRADAYVLEREGRMKREIQIAQRADVVVAIGPRLWAYFKDQLAARRPSPQVARIDCGLKRPTKERTPPIQPTLLCLGRADSINLKGLDIFALAAGHLTKICANNPIMRKRPKPKFIVRGAKEQPEALERQLKDISRTAGTEAAIIVRPYTTDADELTADFLSASVFVMPSREEGFGLVACEALSLGVPLLITSASGFADAVQEMARTSHMSVRECIVGHDGSPGEIGLRYAKAALDILSDEKTAADYTHQLREHLLPTCSWEAAGRELMNLIDLPSAPHVSARTSAPQPHPPKRILRALRVPGDMLPRKAAVEKLKRVLLRERAPNQRTLLTAAAGMGGIGKTVLASLVMEDPDVQARFPDGIVGLTIGRQPPESQLHSEIQQIPTSFNASTEGWDRNTAYGRIERLLQHKAVLIVLDDVWDVNDIGWMPHTLGDSAILITTRSAEIRTAIAGTEIVEADFLEPAEARELLAHRAGVAEENLPPEAAGILSHCGGLAFAVSMAGAMLNGAEAWSDVVTLFSNSRIDEVGLPQEYQKHKNIFDITHSSVEYLPERDRERYLACCVFPDDVAIPETVFGVLWDDPKTYKLTLATLKKRFLLNWDRGVVTFHDLQLDYLRCRTRAETASRHQTLLERYSHRCSGDWSTGPNDGYFFQFLLHHLQEAGRTGEAGTLLYQLPWLEMKLRVTGANAVLADFQGEDSVLPLARALRQAAHILDRHPEALSHQLLARVRESRVRESNTLSGLLSACRRRPGWQPQWPSLEADPALLRTLEGHSGWVRSVAVTGNEVVSGSDDNTIKIWDRQSGQLLRTLEGHSGWVSSVAVTGNEVVSGSGDETIKIWDRQSGQLLRTLEGHSGGVMSVAVTGNEVVSGSSDKTIKIWDRQSGREIYALRIDAAVLSVAMDGDDIAAGDAAGRIHLLRRVNV